MGSAQREGELPPFRTAQDVLDAAEGKSLENCLKDGRLQTYVYLLEVLREDHEYEPYRKDGSELPDDSKWEPSVRALLAVRNAECQAKVISVEAILQLGVLTPQSSQVLSKYMEPQTDDVEMGIQEAEVESPSKTDTSEKTEAEMELEDDGTGNGAIVGAFVVSGMPHLVCEVITNATVGCDYR